MGPPLTLSDQVVRLPAALPPQPIDADGSLRLDSHTMNVVPTSNGSQSASASQSVERRCQLRRLDCFLFRCEFWPGSLL
ncbi:hypothetical protein MRX96_012429 [Rhipicephalus microplus]